MKFTTKEITLLALLGATNGAFEITIGNYLHILHFYFTGNIMIGFNCILYILGKRAVPAKGSILMIGFITAFLKFILGWNISAAIAIFMEALLMEIIIDIMGFNILGVVAGSISANIWALFHKFLSLSISGGASFLNTLNNVINKVSPFLSGSENYIFGALLIITIIYSLWGVVFGIIGWNLTNRIFPKICPD